MKYHYQYQDILNALHEAGLQQGDTAYITTSLGMIGIAEGVSSSDELNHLFLDALKEVLGDTGTIIIPTYSYTIGGGTPEKYNIFDPKTTPAKIGPFPEFFRQQPGVIRSEEPMMSMAGLGPAAAALFKDLPPTSYGADSVYERFLHHPRMKCVSIGLGPNWTPFIHYADWLHQVPHRYDKLFYGGIQTAQGIKETWWVYAVPVRIPEAAGQAHILGKAATEAGIWSYAPLGRARIYVCEYKPYFNFAMNMMESNKWLMTHGQVCDVFKRDQEKMTRITQQMPTTQLPWSEIADAFRILPRKAVDEGIDFIFDYLKKFYSVKVHHVKTGTNVFDWIVPEWIQLDEQGGKQAAISELQYGFLCQAKTTRHFIVCYMDEVYGAQLKGLAQLLKMYDTNQFNQAETSVALVAGHVGFAACLQQVDIHAIQTVVHISEIADMNPLAAGHNPVARECLVDLPFENRVILPDQICTQLKLYS